MATLNGTFSGGIKSQSAITVPDQSGHDLSLAEITGTQKTSDPNWNNANINYWGITDVIDGKGTQRGYFVNTHTDGDTDCGTFEGKVSTAGGQFVVEGTYQYTGGTGRYKGMTGAGTFQTRVTSPRTVEATHQGTYQLAAAAAAG
jgi:hypothetical protein